MAGPGPKCTAARLAVAWTVPAFWPGAMRASRPPAPCRTRPSPQLAHQLPPRPSAAAYVRSAHATGSPAYRSSMRALSTLVRQPWRPGSLRSQATAADARRQRARWPGRVRVGRAQQRPTTRRAACAMLVVPASLLLLTRYGLERGPPPLNPFTACSAAYRVQRSTKPQPGTRARWRRALVATARLATCNPGCCGGRFGGSASSSTHTHAHTLKCTHTHTNTQTRACSACTHAHTHTFAHVHTQTLMCAHIHTGTQTQIQTHTRAAPALAQLRAGMSRNPRRR
jgi:hypothetical protein